MTTRDEAERPDTMPLLAHLEELRSRVFRIAIAYVVALAACWSVSGTILEWLLRPVQAHLVDGDRLVFIHLTEAFVIYVKAAAVAACFVAAPYVLWQIWGFIAPGLYSREKRMAIPFLVSGTLFFVGGGAFGYAVAVPRAAEWLIALGGEFTATITLRSAFGFVSRIVLAMGVVFEMPILIFFLARLGLVTPGWLMRHFRVAVLVIAIVAAVITPTGDMITMSIFVVPMVLLYLLGVAVAWLFGTPRREPEPAREPPSTT